MEDPVAIVRPATPSLEDLDAAMEAVVRDLVDAPLPESLRLPVNGLVPPPVKHYKGLSRADIQAEFRVLQARKAADLQPAADEALTQAKSVADVMQDIRALLRRARSEEETLKVGVLHIAFPAWRVHLDAQGAFFDLVWEGLRNKYRPDFPDCDIHIRMEGNQDTGATAYYSLLT